MARTSTETKSKKSTTSKAVIAKIAEEAGKKAAKKVAAKVASEEAGKTAAKVAARAALDPDYTLDTDYAQDEAEYDLIQTSMFDDSDEDTETYSGSYASRFSNEENELGEDDLSDNPKATDIFSYGTSLLAKGTPIRFQIKKNGQFLTTVREPYSEERLQADHGEGHYTVILRHDAKGTFLKQQSFSIAAPSIKREEIVKAQTDEKLDRMFETFGEMQYRTQEMQSQTFERLMEEQRRREEEEKERRREERELMRQQEQQNQTLLATVLQASLSKKDDGGGQLALMQMLQAQQQQTANMIMESNKNFMTMIQEMRRDTQSMIEKMNQAQTQQAREFREQIEKMANAKKDGFDGLEMFKLLNESRESGMNFGLKINELAKELAGDSESPKEPKGLTETIIDNLGKLAPLMLAAGQNSGQAPAPQYFEQRPSTQLVPAPAAPSFKKPVAPVQAKPVVSSTPVQTSAKAPTSPVVTSRQTKKSANTVVASVGEKATIGGDANTKQVVIDICAPLIGHALMNNVPAVNLGEATIKALTEKNISVNRAVELVTLEDIYTLSFKTYTLPDVPELRAYLKEYHDYLGQKASS